MRDRIKMQEPMYDESDIEAMTGLFRSTYLTMGEKTKQFEKEWSEYTGLPNSVLVNSGSSANLLMIHELKNKLGDFALSTGDEILVPALTWSTTLFPIIQLGLTPRLVDVKQNTFNIDVNSCEAALNENTKAVFAVHLLGNPANMDELRRFCNENDLILIEDCCEATGAKWDGESVGSFGVMSSFSFMYAHQLSTIEGGIVCCNRKKREENFKIARAHGWMRDVGISEEYMEYLGFDNNKFIFGNTGFNVRPTEIQAVLGLGQLKKIEAMLSIRQKNYSSYMEHLMPVAEHIGLQLSENVHFSTRPTFAFGLYLKSDEPGLRKKLVNHLKSSEIESRPIVGGNLARHPFYKMYCEEPTVPLPVSDKIHRCGLYVPNHQEMSNISVKYVCESIIKFFGSSL